MSHPTIHVCPSTSAVAWQLGDFTLRLAAESVARHGRFTVALSGGSLPAVLAKDLKKRAERGQEMQLDKWEIWYADELVETGLEWLESRD
jgi:6-phosphogluconolactonase